MSKRMRSNTGRVVSISTKRPIDKSLITINKNFGNSQTVTDLLTVTYPCTIVGLRWDLITQQREATTTIGHYHGAWAIVLQREGLTLEQLSMSDASTLYNPEQQVLAFGSASMYLAATAADTRDNTRQIHHSGSTKTMRKMQGGDKLVLVCRSEASDLPLNIGGAIQFFCKS